jgi:ribonuclease P protein component
VSKTGFSFPAHLRLRTPAEYKKVFAQPVKVSDKYFTLLAIRNPLAHPRLGLAIAKKSIKRAVDRNKIKRLCRESFRLQQHTLTALDMVVLARKEAATACSGVLRKSLEKLLLHLVSRCDSCS